MGEAFDRTGAFLGGVEADSAREVLEKLQLKHKEATEFRIRTETAQGEQGPSVIAEIENTFTYHKPFGDQPQRYEAIRNIAKSLAYRIHRSCPPSRERSLALTHLQSAIMFANASIAINEREPEQAASNTPA